MVFITPGLNSSDNSKNISSESKWRSGAIKNPGLKAIEISFPSYLTGMVSRASPISGLSVTSSSLFFPNVNLIEAVWSSVRSDTRRTAVNIVSRSIATRSSHWAGITCWKLGYVPSINLDTITIWSKSNLICVAETRIRSIPSSPNVLINSLIVVLN